MTYDSVNRPGVTRTYHERRSLYLVDAAAETTCRTFFYVRAWHLHELLAARAGKEDFKGDAAHPPRFPEGYPSDRRLEGNRDCDRRVDLAGLNEQAMLDGWASLRRDQVPYNMVRHNCSTVIASLLAIGSGIDPGFTPRMSIGKQVPALHHRLLLHVRYLGNSIEMWTPDQVWRYAQDIRRKLNPP